MPTPETPPASKSSKIGGVWLILAGIGVFVLCSIIQAAGGSHMFTLTYVRPENALLDILMKVTWWPGWILTVLLVISGIRELMQSKN
ncbi:MAG: hypothetical protein IRY85_00710 [Micromonosporaceae bacterium]|jgi:hypothetical protein|nr:hypothetical protein [Micromonosporaceae bacterium]